MSCSVISRVCFFQRGREGLMGSSNMEKMFYWLLSERKRNMMESESSMRLADFFDDGIHSD